MEYTSNWYKVKYENGYFITSPQKKLYDMHELNQKGSHIDNFTGIAVVEGCKRFVKWISNYIHYKMWYEQGRF